MATTFCAKDHGRLARLYRNTGSVASPTWTEVKEARDLSLDMTPDVAENGDRSSIFKLFSPGQISMKISGKMTYRNGNANCAAFRDLMLSGCSEQMALVDGDITTAGTQGIKAGFAVSSNVHNFALADGMNIDFELVPTYYESPLVAGTQIVPAWITIS